ncbi:hypothetical protein B9N43_14620 [Denitratisoma sp. DHT3]|nr:hypothetical protein B9N43_14620 [Denitratisoma sp. DHT3]
MAQARKAIGLTQDEFGKAVGGSKPGIQDNEKGKTLPGGKVLFGFVKAGINVNWVLTGEGSMLLADLGTNAPKRGYSTDAGRPLKATEPQVQVFSPAVLEDVVQGLEKVLSDAGRVLPPAKKAEVIALLYQEIAEIEDAESRRNRVLHLVRLVS